MTRVEGVDPQQTSFLMRQVFKKRSAGCWAAISLRKAFGEGT